MRHTPGPWSWDQGDVGQDYSVPYCTVSSADEIVIAEVNDRFDRDIGRANARLIAAAPDLLEKLERFEQELASFEESCMLPTPLWIQHNLDSVRAVLAKAYL